MNFKMLSAICFNLDQPKILLSCNGLNYLVKDWTVWVQHEIVHFVPSDYAHNKNFDKTSLN